MQAGHELQAPIWKGHQIGRPPGSTHQGWFCKQGMGISSPSHRSWNPRLHHPVPQLKPRQVTPQLQRSDHCDLGAGGKGTPGTLFTCSSWGIWGVPWRVLGSPGIAAVTVRFPLPVFASSQQSTQELGSSREQGQVGSLPAATAAAPCSWSPQDSEGHRGPDRN